MKIKEIKKLKERKNILQIKDILIKNIQIKYEYDCIIIKINIIKKIQKFT